jgi:nicotinamide riboside transporter PnuC
MTFLSIIGWLATIGGISGQVFIMFKKTNGWYIWTVAAIFQIIFAYLTGSISQLVLWIFFLAMDAMSLIKWKMDDKKTKVKNV